jgi:selenobiotic family peptide radical SAM maturase
MDRALKPKGSMTMTERFSDIFPLCRSLLDVNVWLRLLNGAGSDTLPDTFPDFLEHQGESGIHPFLSGLARIELARYAAAGGDSAAPSDRTGYTLNPSLSMIPLGWQNLARLFDGSEPRDLTRVVPGEEIVLVWRDQDDGTIMTAAAGPEDLLAIKLVAEDIDPHAVPGETGVAAGTMEYALRVAAGKGILLAPPSLLRRAPEIAASAPGRRFAAAGVFTLQWHLTQQCDLSCRHCYDRSDRPDFPFERGLTLLDELQAFCRRRHVRGQVTLSGGNPLLYPRFFELYRAAAERDFMIAILGNAAGRTDLERIMSIRAPAYYQVSLEGLEEHNDEIRGKGNFKRTVEFLRILTTMGVPNMVMLTLTRRNIGQVIPLAGKLEGVAGGLTFNRLAPFGRGASLEMPTKDEYRSFLADYCRALDRYPVLALKDSLLNILFEENDGDLFGGCTGYGCGAAFNFVSILSDGEAHACRKFPSPVGNVFTQSLEEVYDSEPAARYRAGSSACVGCRLRAVCGGCMAVTQGLGLDPMNDKDPFCFRKNASFPMLRR